jgi:holo-[acyl-carrier protein] synthase
LTLPPAGPGDYHGGMSIVAHGIDMVDCTRLQEMIDRHGQKFLDRIFTSAEQDYCRDRKRATEHLAGRFAAKEAVLKVLGTGWRDGITWTDIEIHNSPSGQPHVRLTGRCRAIADELDLASVLISISHIGTHAIASAIGARTPVGGAAAPAE